jgi:phosphoheptose isomerase
VGEFIAHIDCACGKRAEYDYFRMESVLMHFAKVGPEYANTSTSGDSINFLPTIEYAPSKSMKMSALTGENRAASTSKVTAQIQECHITEVCSDGVNDRPRDLDRSSRS